MHSLLGLIFTLAQVGATTTGSSAGTSVDGFFTEDYVRSGVFSGQEQSPFLPSSADSPRGTYWKNRNQAAANYQSVPTIPIYKNRMYHGRFVKSTRGVERSKVQGAANEWDVQAESFY